MARIDTATIRNQKYRHVNVCYPVGTGEVNRKDDVMLIQALMRIINYHEGNQYLFGEMSKNMPAPNGIWDDRTLWAIWTFELNLKHSLLKADGKIHPANYKNRNLKNVTDKVRLMTITRMNFYALDGSHVKYQGVNVPDAVTFEAPEIVFSCAVNPPAQVSEKSML